MTLRDLSVTNGNNLLFTLGLKGFICNEQKILQLQLTPNKQKLTTTENFIGNPPKINSVIASSSNNPTQCEHVAFIAMVYVV